MSTSPNPEPASVPAELIRKLEEGFPEWTCDWGDCNRISTGFACNHSMPTMDHVLGKPGRKDWLTICEPCAMGAFPDANVDPVPVDEYWPFDVLDEAMRGGHSSFRDARMPFAVRERS